MILLECSLSHISYSHMCSLLNSALELFFSGGAARQIRSADIINLCLIVHGISKREYQ